MANAVCLVCPRRPHFGPLKVDGKTTRKTQSDTVKRLYAPAFVVSAVGFIGLFTVLYRGSPALQEIKLEAVAASAQMKCPH